MRDFKSHPALDIVLALTRVGELLAAAGQPTAIVVLGGAALNLHGYVRRATADVDVVALAQGNTISAPPEPLPEPLRNAVRAVARRMQLPEDWLNTVAALQWRQGLPPGLADRLEWRAFGGALRVGLVSRYDLIFFKLYAAADENSPRGVHFRDLISLAPTQDELAAAAAWIRTQDPPPGFAGILDATLHHVQVAQ
jgi:hypothetical protein